MFDGAKYLIAIGLFISLALWRERDEDEFKKHVELQKRWRK